MAREVAIASLGGPPYPDGSSGVHIPRRILDTGATSSEWVSGAPAIRLSVAGKAVSLETNKTPPLQAVASKAATNGGGYIVFFARPGVRMLVRLEGLDERLADIESTVTSGPYALFPHQARAALAECGDSFLGGLTETGVVIERHCAYDERSIDTLIPPSSGLLVPAAHSYRATRLQIGDWSCDCDERLENHEMPGDTVSGCTPSDIIAYMRNEKHELLIAHEQPYSSYLRQCLYKHESKCATAVQCRRLFAYGGVTCTLFVWRCSRSIGSINQPLVVPIPAEIALVWEYGAARMPSAMYARPREGHEWRMSHIGEERPAPRAFPAGTIPFPPFLYQLSTSANGGVRMLIPRNLDAVTRVEASLKGELDEYNRICAAMDPVAYVARGERYVPLSESGGTYSDNEGSVAFHVQGGRIVFPTGAAVAHVLFNSGTRLFALVSTPPVSPATLRASPLSPLWSKLHELSAAAAPVRLDHSTLEAIGALSSERDAWIPAVSLREVASVALPSSPAPFDLFAGASPSPLPAPRATTPSGTPLPALRATTSSGTGTGATATASVRTQSADTAAPAAPSLSALIGVAVLLGVVVLLLRAKRHRRR